MIALALRITVEVFRVLTQDTEKLTAKTLLDYYNATELVPFTVSQLMEIFEIFNIDNIKSNSEDWENTGNQKSGCFSTAQQLVD